jgi:hypothetical protein
LNLIRDVVYADLINQRISCVVTMFVFPKSHT